VHNSLESNFDIRLSANQIFTLFSEFTAKAKFMELVDHVLHLFSRQIQYW